jgi:hypothetical protein
VWQRRLLVVPTRLIVSANGMPPRRRFGGREILRFDLFFARSKLLSQINRTPKPSTIVNRSFPVSCPSLSFRLIRIDVKRQSVLSLPVPQSRKVSEDQITAHLKLSHPQNAPTRILSGLFISITSLISRRSLFQQPVRLRVPATSKSGAGG